jgi:hypothetical protein
VNLKFNGFTNTADIEMLILYVRHINNTGVRDVFLAVLPLNNATAYGYLDAIQKELDEHGLLDWLSSCKLIGTGNDGTANKTGTENGLIQQIRQNVTM